jgi:hypothetical protein
MNSFWEWKKRAAKNLIFRHLETDSAMLAWSQSNRFSKNREILLGLLQCSRTCPKWLTSLLKAQSICFLIWRMPLKFKNGKIEPKSKANKFWGHIPTTSIYTPSPKIIISNLMKIPSIQELELLKIWKLNTYAPCQTSQFACWTILLRWTTHS